MPKLSFACLLLLSAMITSHSAFAAGDSAALCPAEHRNLSQLETKFFGHSYQSETEGKRIQRLESFVFGSSPASPTASRLHERYLSLLNCTHLDESSQPVNIPSAVRADVSTGVKQDSALPRAAVRTADRADKYRALYPRVTQIEQLLLGQSFEEEKIENRLDRLELKSFGKRSLFPDLGSRVDFLSDYASAFHPAGFRVQQEVLNVSYEPQVVQQSRPFFGVVDQIELLEKSVYGSIHANKTLQRRVDSLEQSIYGKAGGFEADQLSQRVGRLWIAVMSGGSGHQSRKDS